MPLLWRESEERIDPVPTQHCGGSHGKRHLSDPGRGKWCEATLLQGPLRECLESVASQLPEPPCIMIQSEVGDRLRHGCRDDNRIDDIGESDGGSLAVPSERVRAALATLAGHDFGGAAKGVAPGRQ